MEWLSLINILEPTSGIEPLT
ncbi:MAG: hypothetical protein JWP13_443, partial [Candidatus Saccharibacteria bacterium]|nr:hypothetical protein [Candidatus Saccharibacteria bacterium]